MRSIHTRILLSYIALIVVSIGISAIAIHEVLVIRLESRVAEAVQQEFLEMRRLTADGHDPRTGAAFTTVQAVFDVYFRRNVPSNEEAVLAFAEGRLHHAALSRFPIDRLPEPVLGAFAEAAGAAAPGPDRPPLASFDTPRGAAYYAVLPIRVGASSGAFVVTILPVGERAEIARLQRYGAAVILGVLILASACAWLVTGRVLGPVRQLTETARLISQSDLTRRIPVGRQREAAEMAGTFNAMLDRLEAVFRREREFIADASHELRGPLTISLGNLGLLDREVADNPQWRGTIALVSDELVRMGRIVWVRDTGCGVPPKDQPYIFDRLRRGSRAHLRYPGSGLGLSIVKAIAVAHGGRVELVSRPGAGARFTLVVPARPGEGTAPWPGS